MTLIQLTPLDLSLAALLVLALALWIGRKSLSGMGTATRPAPAAEKS